MKLKVIFYLPKFSNIERKFFIYDTNTDETIFRYDLKFSSIPKIAHFIDPIDDLQLFKSCLNNALDSFNKEKKPCNGVKRLKNELEKYLDKGERFTNLTQEIIADFVDYFLCV